MVRPRCINLFCRNDPFCLPIFGFWFELWSIYMRLVTSGSKKYRQQNKTYHSSVAMSYNSVSSDGIYWLMDVVAIDECKQMFNHVWNDIHDFCTFFYNTYEVTICTNVFSPYDQLRKMAMKLLKGVVFFQNIV